MNIENWFSLATNSCQLLESYTSKAFQKNEEVNSLIKRISQKISDQWISTHNSGIKQVEEGLTTQGKLITSQYDVTRLDIELS